MRRSSRWLARLQSQSQGYSAEQSEEPGTRSGRSTRNTARSAGGAGTEHAMRQARWIVEDNWDAVTKVAEALEKHGTLSDEDVAALLS